jgi:ABC-type nitrate/sulfonate/bicarbonate transport system ATPase subunit
MIRDSVHFDETQDTAAGRLALEVRGVWAHYSIDNRLDTVLEDISFTACNGELVAIIGPSGCGKSTLFNVIAGLSQPSAGTISLGGQATPRRLGRVGYMPQKDLLLPWKRVLDNAALGLELDGMKRGQARDEARRWFRQFGLEGFESCYPRVLSGGMRQRAALLRTFLSGRDLLLLDEPFGALDALTRLDMQSWLLEVRSSFRKTIVLVTHDIEEAIYLSDRVYVMTPRPGTIRRVVRIPLPRPRVHEDLITSSIFARLKREIFQCLQRRSEMDK